MFTDKTFLVALANLASCQQESTLRFEAIEPLVASSVGDLTINLFGVNFDAIINDQWTYDEFGMPVDHVLELKDGVEINLIGQIESIPCRTDDAGFGLVPVDPNFPQQAVLRSSHMIKCRTEEGVDASESTFEIVVTMPSKMDGDDDFMLMMDPVDMMLFEGKSFGNFK